MEPVADEPSEQRRIAVLAAADGELVGRHRSVADLAQRPGGPTLHRDMVLAAAVGAAAMWMRAPWVPGLPGWRPSAR